MGDLRFVNFKHVTELSTSDMRTHTHKKKETKNHDIAIQYAHCTWLVRCNGFHSIRIYFKDTSDFSFIASINGCDCFTVRWENANCRLISCFIASLPNYLVQMYVDFHFMYQNNVCNSSISPLTCSRKQLISVHLKSAGGTLVKPVFFYKSQTKRI